MGRRGSQPEAPQGYWAQLPWGSEAAKLPCSWRGAAFSPECLQRSWEEQQGRRVAPHGDLEQLSSLTGLTRAHQTSASSW